MSGENGNQSKERGNIRAKSASMKSTQYIHGVNDGRPHMKKLKRKLIKELQDVLATLI